MCLLWKTWNGLDSKGFQAATRLMVLCQFVAFVVDNA